MNHYLSVNPSLLDYLVYRAKTNDDESLLKIIQQAKNQEFCAVEQFFFAVDPIWERTSKPPIQFSTKIHPKKNSYQKLVAYIKSLFDETNIPIKFRRQFSIFKQRCTIKHISEADFLEIVESAVTLLLNMKKHAVPEQESINTFLTNITQQLSLIEERTLQVSVDNQISIDNRSHFSNEMNNQVNTIIESAHQASELKLLQQNIQCLLEKLNTKIQLHHSTEESLQLMVQKQLLEVTQKLQVTEAEAFLLRNQLQIAHNLAYQDTLTGLANRLAYDQRIEHEIKRWQHAQQPLSVIVWDIDHFKNINDIYGHKSGDKALISIAQLLIQHSRNSDFVARYGGEEFVMLLPGTNSSEAFELAEKIRNLIGCVNFNANNEIIKITVSAGIHQLIMTDTNESAFEQADKALYEAKLHGRNQCKISDFNYQRRSSGIT